MFDALIDLFESKNSSRMLTLRNQLRCISMSSSDTINSYLMKIFQLRDHLTTIEDPINDKELVTITLNGLPTSWEPFIQGVCVRDKLPSFDKLWANCVQEESRLISRNNLQRLVDNGEQALAAHTQKGKKSKRRNTRRFPSSTPDHRARKGKDVSKVQCFRRDKFGHYARGCPERKNHHASYANKEPPQKKKKLQDSSSEGEYTL